MASASTTTTRKYPAWLYASSHRAGGNLDEMRRMRPMLAPDYDVQVAEARPRGEKIRDSLHLSAATDGVVRLHSSIAPSNRRLTLSACDGAELRELFGSKCLQR